MEERLYATQMEAARKGIVTKELEIVAKRKNGSKGAFTSCSKW